MKLINLIGILNLTLGHMKYIQMPVVFQGRVIGQRIKLIIFLRPLM